MSGRRPIEVAWYLRQMLESSPYGEFDMHPEVCLSNAQTQAAPSPELTAAPVSSPEAGAVGVALVKSGFAETTPDVRLAIELDDQEVRMVRRTTTQPMRSIKGHRQDVDRTPC